MNLLFALLTIGFATIFSLSIGVALFGKDKEFYYLAISTAAAMFLFGYLAGVP